MSEQRMSSSPGAGDDENRAPNAATDADGPAGMRVATHTWGMRVAAHACAHRRKWPLTELLQ